jgi:hypothetical protein
MLPDRSPSRPAAQGPIVWAQAKTTVNRPIARPQASGGRLRRVKLVTAPGAMKTEAPNTTADRISPAGPGHSTGSAEPAAMPPSTSASGTPPSWRENTPRQSAGDSVMHAPSSTQTSATCTTPAACSAIQADRKVR